ncbi:ATP-binding cassette domain-containing protein [Microbacterium sp. H37-C3]|uniref:ABC transporter ATP-binding protein n=1 Tax=Microbacterium sp. H37-C3 TaxID=3004354 RepID=UPI0022AF58B4|nr:ATP-binding cassette domain-containing protein [Microbacterium sp. H37-C3]MCZ4069079.1 ATP-binding cassette domain-containing protein [Microbacterium sp. H37-C3]
MTADGRATLALEHVDFAYGRSANVLHDVSLSLAPGETVGLVGESGAGKTSVLRLLLGLATPTSGRALFEGAPLRGANRAQMRSLRRAVQPVYQDPFSSLDPRMTVGQSIAEPLRSLGLTRDRSQLDARVAELLTAVDLDADAAGRYPDAFSGGQRQRIAIARALAPRPRLLLADEPVSALDTSVRMHVIQLFQRLAAEQGIGMLLVSHDLTIVSALCERMTVLRAGRVVEEGPTSRLLTSPANEYTAQLVDAVPRLPAE